MADPLRLARAAAAAAAILTAGLVAAQDRESLIATPPDPEVVRAFAATCAGCHGSRGQGANGPSLLLPTLKHGAAPADLVRSITSGNPRLGMPAFAGILTAAEIRQLAAHVAGLREAEALAVAEGHAATPPPEAPAVTLPQGTISSVSARFTVEHVGKVGPAFGFAFLPDGDILVSETGGALRLLREGSATVATITDTPAPGPLTESLKRAYFDVGLHPDFGRNGWVYLIYSGNQAASGTSEAPLTLTRGKLRNGRWVEGETLLTVRSQLGSSARIAWGPDGFLYFGTCEALLVGDLPPDPTPPQDLSREEGKILRLTDDGKPAPGNPFLGTGNAFPYIWSYGHRVPIGLAFDRQGHLWESENGPFGGDELNRIQPGRNYGWPLTSWGHHYDFDQRPWRARPVTPDTEQPVINFSPSPGLGGLAIYTGGAFTEWQDNLLLGTLKDTSLYRIVFDGDREVLRETLLHGVGRIRDIDTGPDGLVYLLFDDGTLARLRPVG